MRSRRAAAALGAAALCFLTACQTQSDTTPPDEVSQALRGAFYALDGDTIAVEGEEGTARRIRLLGIDAPEHGDCGSDEARDLLEQLVDVDELILTFDPRSDREDRYGRTLAYIGTDDHDDLAQVLLAEGLVNAWWPSRAVEPARGASYTDNARQAQLEDLGNWQRCGDVGR